MTNPVLVFLKNEANEKDGLGDAGIETFRDAPYASCAREAGQNSRDAMLNDNFPVKLTFDVLRISAEEIPSLVTLASAISQCKEEAAGEKEQDFFKHASAVVGGSLIPVLRIADYNTKGLSGPPDEPNSPFNALLKGAGVSRKETETSGGSFGIGKNASFAVSDLQSVFYSSLYKNLISDEPEFAAQGKVKLISHIDVGGENRRAVGYWGKAEFSAITDINAVPSWMRREELGTSIFSLGFRETSNWPEIMACSLIMNFFVAIKNKEMVFEIDSQKILINANTIESLMSAPSIVQAAKLSGFTNYLEFSRHLYCCQVSAASTLTLFDIVGLGKVQVRILVEKGLPKKVGFIRNGMLITDNLRHFDFPLTRFSNSQDFIAIVEPADSQASKLFKNLENPAHDAFSAERITDPAKRKDATKALRELGRCLRKTIKDVTGIKSQSSLVLDELGRYFSNGGKSKSESEQGTENDPEYYTYEAIIKNPKILKPASENSKDGGGGGGGVKKPRHNDDPKNTLKRPKADRYKGDAGPESVKLVDVRNRICLSEESLSVREIFFTADIDRSIVFSIQALGVNTPQTLKVVKSSLGKVHNGKIFIDVKSNIRTSIKVFFNGSYDGPIELIAFSNVQSEIVL
ncbi:hypothetical protein [Pseudomonas viridiflava]|uniref:hypothetical protein n=1 Tax=Pseudomonas viridiflava TaxID=33069 RepID=UPI001303016D|nr:hypothetical protein [Pseudomonas viridiflava]